MLLHGLRRVAHLCCGSGVRHSHRRAASAAGRHSHARARGGVPLPAAPVRARARASARLPRLIGSKMAACCGSPKRWHPLSAPEESPRRPQRNHGNRQSDHGGGWRGRPLQGHREPAALPAVPLADGAPAMRSAAMRAPATAEAARWSNSSGLPPPCGLEVALRAYAARLPACAPAATWSSRGRERHAHSHPRAVAAG